MDAKQEFQTAVGLYESGNLTGAGEILARLYQAFPRQPQVLHLLSLVLLRSGRAEDALEPLKALAAVVPDDTGVLEMLGSAYRQAGRLQASVRTFEKALSLAPDNAALHYNLANALRNRQDFDKAADHYRRAAELAPDNVDAWFNLGETMMALDNWAEAAADFRKAVTLNPRDAEAQTALARCCLRLGDPEAAVAALEAALAAQPQDTTARALHADAALASGDLTTASADFRALVAAAPDRPEFHLGLVDATERTGDGSGALEACLAAAGRFPDDPAVQARLADLYERQDDLDEAWRVINAALPAASDDAGLALVAARLERRQGDVEAGIARLKALPRASLVDKGLAADIHFELGSLYDHLDRPGDAIENFDLGNRLLVAATPDAVAMMARSKAYVDRLRQAYDGVVAETAPVAADPTAPVFLVGFPGSGTTLLGRLLAAHPGLQVLEELPTLLAVRQAGIAQDPSFPANLGRLGESDLAILRSAYRDSVARLAGPLGGGTVIDGMPLNILDAGLIHRMFPGARFILALRHPCDACLDSFMQPFALNEAMIRFTSLNETVAFYGDVMTLWQSLRDRFALNVHTLRLEDLMADQEGEMRKLLDFLGLPWDPAVIAKGARPPIDRWRKYEIHMLPHLRHLKPHIDAFGYDT